MNYEESHFQVEVVNWLQERHIFFFAVPNDLAKGDMKRNMIYKALGLRAGVADIVVLLPYGRTIFLELKTENGVQKEKQKTFQRRVESLGFEYFIIRCLSDLDPILPV